MSVKKKDTLKPRGIRFSDDAWKNIERDVKKDKTKRTTSSDVVRHIVDLHYSQNKKPR